MYLALRKCKNDCKIFFSPLKPIARSAIGFRLNSFELTVRFPFLFQNVGFCHITSTPKEKWCT